MELIDFSPRCISDWKDNPNCFAFVRCYKKQDHKVDIVNYNEIKQLNGFSAIFEEEVKAYVSEWYQDYFRVTVPHKTGKKERSRSRYLNIDEESKLLDLFFNEKYNYTTIYGDYVFYLIFRKNKKHISKCI